MQKFANNSIKREEKNLIMNKKVEKILVDPHM